VLKVEDHSPVKLDRLGDFREERLVSERKDLDGGILVIGAVSPLRRF
jgi:hypothetical protein